ncbi:MAG: SDR family oxidoreductase [Lautropia sp.]
MSTALVIGASRGLGFEFTRQYLADGWRVFGTWRAEPDRVRLRDAGAQTLRLDVNDASDLAGIGWQLDGERIDVIVMNAGVYGPRTSHPRRPPTEPEFDLVMRTNVLAALRLLPIVTPLAVATGGTLAFVSSRMGSLTETAASYGALYRVSKAAVNMVSRLAHVELAPQGARVVTLHPGWVRTDMGGPNADVDVADSVAGQRRVIADRAGHPSGGFYDWRGQPVAW